MNKKNIAIALLLVSAAFLLVLNVFVTTPAKADLVVKDRDYQVVTAKISTGGDALYIFDARSGQVAILTFDATSRELKVRDVRPVSDAFPMPK